MGWAIWYIICAVCGLMIGIPAATAQEKNDAWDITEEWLENGLRVVVVPDTRAPTVTHTLWIQAGAAVGPAERTGVAHFLEHMMFKATSTQPQGAFARAISDWGGTQNAFTDHDTTVFFQRIPPDALASSMQFDADRLRNLAINANAVNAERRVIARERAIRIDQDTPSQMVEALSEVLFGTHPYARSILGKPQDIERISPKDLQVYYDRYYQPGNAMLLVVGDVDGAEVIEMARATYGQISGTPNSTKTRNKKPPQSIDQTLTLSGTDVSTASLRHSWVVPGRATAQPGEREALILLSYILGTETNGRLSDSLVRNDKIATSIRAQFSDVGHSWGVFTLFGVPATETSLDTLQVAMHRQIRNILEYGPDPKELAAAKRRYAMRSVFDRDDQLLLAVALGKSLIDSDTAVSAFNERAEFEIVNVMDVRAAARRWLDIKSGVIARLESIEEPK